MFTEQLYRQMAKAEDDVLRKVLTAYLGKEPTTEDAKDCSCIFRVGDTLNYTLCHNKIPIGTVNKNISTTSVTVTFNPL